MDTIEEIVFSHHTVHVFKIPPQKTSAGHKCGDWEGNHIWTGKIRVVNAGGKVVILLEDKTNNELFARCPIDNEKGLSVEPTIDSSRYFVLRIENEQGQKAFIGMGFEERNIAFDFKCSLSKEKQRNNASTTVVADDLGDLSLRDGQTVKLNVGLMNRKKESTSSPSQAKATTIRSPSQQSRQPAQATAPAPSEWVSFDA